MSAFLLGTGFRADMGTCIRKLVLLKLIDACEDDGSRIFPAIATVARAAQCSPRQVQREIRAFLEIGLLTLVREGGKGRRSTNEYALDLDVLGAISRDGWDAYADVRGGIAKGDTQSPLDDDAKGDTGDADRVTPETPKGDIRSHTTPPDSSIEPSERAEAREREGESEDQDLGDTPGTAAFDKRVMRFCNGTKFAAGPWPDWDTSSPGWIGRQFGKLDAAERMEAERWRDAYLLDMRQRGKSPVTVGIFLRDKLWTGLDSAILARVDRVKAGRPVEEAKPDGWAKCLGPVGMAFLFGKMLAGPADAELAARPFLSDAMLREAWPAVWWWQASQRQKGGGVFADAWHGLRDQMVPVPADSGAMAEWKAEFTRRGWRWLAALDGLDVVYCPKGGPAGLSAFEAAVNEGQGDDGGEREAAE